MTSFLDDKKDKHMRTAKQQQEMTLETLELFGEMYMTISLFPLLLIIVMVVMGLLGRANPMMLYQTVYGLIPLTSIGFLVILSTVKKDEFGTGYLSREQSFDAPIRKRGLFSMDLVNGFVGTSQLFDRIKRRESLHRTGKFFKAPHRFFHAHPFYAFIFSIPLAVVFVAILILQGSAPTTIETLIERPIMGTFAYVYLPVYVGLTPFVIFYEWNNRSRNTIITNLSETLRKLSSTNETGLTLMESIQTVSDASTGKLAQEFEVITAKVEYGMSLKDALIEFNNSYHVPRLARTVKLISKAQETSSQISSVLRTAAQASENQDDIERQRRSRTRMQVVIMVMTFLTLLAVMAILKTQFLDVMAGLALESTDSDAPSSFGGGIDTDVLNLLFFHAVTLQAIFSGVISGYIRDANLASGAKFVIVLLTITLSVWIVVA